MHKRIPIVLGLILVALSLWLQISPPRFVSNVIERLENLGYDLQLRTRVLTEKPQKSSSIAIVDIDDKSLKTEGHWPWPRARLAELVQQLKNQGVSVIAFDMLFSEKEANVAENLIQKINAIHVNNAEIVKILHEQQFSLEGDRIFAESFNNADVVLALGFLPHVHMANVLPPPLLTLDSTLSKELRLITQTGYISNIPVLQNAVKYSGSINIFPDSDGIVRRSPLIIQYQNDIYGMLALQAVLAHLKDKISLITPLYNNMRQLEGIRIGGQVITTDPYGQILIPFIGRSFTFPYFSATDVLHNNIQKDALLGKIVFVGTSATGLSDIKPTSIDNLFPGIEIQATIANGLIENNFSHKPAWTFAANLSITLLLGILCAFIFPYFGPRLLTVVIILLPEALLFFNNFVWKETGLILSFLMPTILVLVLAVTNLIYGYLFETRRREHLKEMFGQYVPETHIDEMLKKSSNFALTGEDRTMSVLFADIRNFTALSENLPAANLVELLNGFLTAMTEIIFKHQGTIDKYVGDLIMAFWGAPLKDKYHARHAIASALEMQNRLKEMRIDFAKRNLPEIRIGIGINSGLMSVGDMGSKYRRNYTVLGDSVNLASRLESLTKYYGVEIIISESTAQEQNRFVLRKLDMVKVKGKKNAIAIFEVLGVKDKVSQQVLAELNTYHEALTYYYNREWENAESIFLALQKAAPQKIYEIYLQRISDYKQHPVSQDWDGVYVHTTK